MKIEQLKLIAFGPFTNMTLDTSPGNPGLHIIYGPNESGKSSSLRALRHLLFGFPQQSSDNFIHANANLRIACKLSRSDGTNLSFTRRKGRLNTLRDADDNHPIQDANLISFLNGMQQHIFESMFCIDHSDLIRGGQALCYGKGDLGQILFSAGSGGADVQAATKKLTEEMEILFLPAGTKPKINAGITDLNDTKRIIREFEVHASTWEKCDAKLQEAQKAREALDIDISVKEQERCRMERIKQAIPLATKRTELQITLKELHGTIQLPSDFGEKSLLLQNNLLRTNVDIAKNTDELQKQMELRETVSVLPGFIEQAAVIDDLQKQYGSHQKATQDKSSLSVRHNQLQAGILACLSNLGQPQEIERCENLRITTSERSKIRELATAKVSIDADVRSATKTAENLNRLIENGEAQLAELKQCADPEQLKKTLRRIESKGALESQLTSTQAKFDHEKLKLKSLVRTLFRQENASVLESIEAERWDDIKELAIPNLNAIEHWHNVFEEALANQNAIITMLQKEELELEEIDRRLNQARIEMNVPTEEDLLKLREHRDHGWHLIKKSWRDGENNAADLCAWSSADDKASDIAVVYETAVSSADNTSDRLRREAGKVAEKAALLAQKSKLSLSIAQQTGRIDTCNIKQASIESEWKALWSPSGLVPTAPKEMRNWQQSFQQALKQINDLEDTKQQICVLNANIEECKNELRQSLTAVGEGLRCASESLAMLIEQCATVIETSSASIIKSKNLVSQLAERSLESKSAQTEKADADAALSQWYLNWSEAIKPLGLEPSASPSEANAVLDTLDSMFKSYAEMLDLSNRISAIDRDELVFKKNVKELTDKIAPDLNDFPSGQAASEMNARLAQARVNKATLETLNTNITKTQKELEKYKSEQQDLVNQLQAMVLQAKCVSFDDLQTAASKSALYVTTKEKLEEIEEQLLQLSGGKLLEPFTEEVGGQNFDSLAVEIVRLDSDIELCKGHRSDLDQAIGACRVELSMIDGGAKAAEAAEKVEQLAAEIASSSASYARLRLAKFLLNKSVERYRERHQSPVLTKASRIFEALTLGSFCKLKDDYTEKGDPILVGIRADSQTAVGLDGMSEGTCDQLYLALRLASLQLYLDVNEPIPFIVDDIMVNFDDDRATATLSILQEIAKRTQIIFFTHHPHIVSLAQKTLNQEELFVHNLQREAVVAGR